MIREEDLPPDLAECLLRRGIHAIENPSTYLCYGSIYGTWYIPLCLGPFIPLVNCPESGSIDDTCVYIFPVGSARESTSSGPYSDRKKADNLHILRLRVENRPKVDLNLGLF